MRTWPRALLVVAPIVACLGLASCSTPTEPRAGATTSEQATLSSEDYAEALFTLTNDERRAEGLRPLRHSACAEQAAITRAEELVGKPLEHAPMGPVLGSCGTDAAGENLADSDASPKAVVDAWMESPGHRNNIVAATWDEMGIACTQHNVEMLCSQLFLAFPTVDETTNS